MSKERTVAKENIVSKENTVSAKDAGRTGPSVIDVAQGNKGTAAPDPVLVVTPHGEIAGTRVGVGEPVSRSAHTHDGAEPGEAKDTRSPAEIEADLDRTRAHLSETLDELSERLSPRDLARRGGRRVKAQFVDPQTGRIRRGPVGAAIGGLGAAVGALTLFLKVRDRDR